MNMGFLKQAMQGMDEEDARMILDQLDEEQIAAAVEWSVEEMVVPHLDDVKHRSDLDDPEPAEVRELYEKKSPQEQEDIFYDVLHQLIATIIACRQNPQAGFAELKTMLRDPFTVEGLLLIFNGEDPETGEMYIDPNYTQTLKDFGAAHIRWVAASVIPEMYTEEELREVRETFDLDPENGNVPE